MFFLKFAIFLSFYLVNAVNIVPFLSNGDDAQITEFPFLVSIQQINVHVCAGTALSERWILSSARCYLRRPLEQLNIEFGNSIITPGPVGENKASISRVVMHHGFVETGFVNDVCLVEAATSMLTGYHETFAKLPVPGGSHFRSGTLAVHSGWGHIRQNVRTTSLQKANLNVLSHEECLVAVNGTQRPTKLHICAIADSVMCTGDMGKVASVMQCPLQLFHHSNPT